MSEHRVAIRWENAGAVMDYEHFSRDHAWVARDGRVRIRGSAAPGYHGSADALDPEDALVGALASCHMLTFLAIASKRRLIVRSYRDEAVGVLEADAAGKLAVTRVTLRPVVEFATGTVVTQEDFTKLHHKAHENCFIANSVRTAVAVEARQG